MLVIMCYCSFNGIIDVNVYVLIQGYIYLTFVINKKK